MFETIYIDHRHFNTQTDFLLQKPSDFYDDLGVILMSLDAFGDMYHGLTITETNVETTPSCVSACTRIDLAQNKYLIAAQ